jgi:hypothetical protein
MSQVCLILISLPVGLCGTFFATGTVVAMVVNPRSVDVSNYPGLLEFILIVSIGSMVIGMGVFYLFVRAINHEHALGHLLLVLFGSVILLGVLHVATGDTFGGVIMIGISAPFVYLGFRRATKR